MSVARPEDPVAVLLEEEIGLAEWRHAARLGDVLDAEGRVVLALPGDQRLAQRVARLPGLAIRLAVRDRGAVRAAVQDRDPVVGARRAVERIEEALLRRRDEEGVARDAPVALAARVI